MKKIWSLSFIALIICATGSIHASIIKRPPVKTIDVSYTELVCTAQDQANIYEIISTMAENSKLNLLFNQTHIRELGAQINHVHPLKLLGFVFSNPYLKNCMSLIWDDYFKRNGFMDGLGPSLAREVDKGKLYIYLNDFANQVGAPVEPIRSLCDSRDWDRLVIHLTNL